MKYKLKILLTAKALLSTSGVFGAEIIYADEQEYCAANNCIAEGQLPKAIEKLDGVIENGRPEYVLWAALQLLNKGPASIQWVEDQSVRMELFDQDAGRKGIMGLKKAARRGNKDISERAVSELFINIDTLNLKQEESVLILLNIIEMGDLKATILAAKKLTSLGAKSEGVRALQKALAMQPSEGTAFYNQWAAKELILLGEIEKIANWIKFLQDAAESVDKNDSANVVSAVKAGGYLAELAETARDGRQLVK